jgi:enamine deaminase RidA (YjgF/YER057c/UK114 family)
MEIRRLKTDNHFEEINSYSRVVTVGPWLLLANTAGRDHTTGELSTDPEQQMRQAVTNVSRALAAAGSELAEVVRLTVRIPERANVRRLMPVVGEAFRGIDPAMTIICTPLAGDYAVELEATAYHGAGSDTHEHISLG